VFGWSTQMLQLEGENLIRIWIGLHNLIHFLGNPTLIQQSHVTLYNITFSKPPYKDLFKIDQIINDHEWTTNSALLFSDEIASKPCNHNRLLYVVILYKIINCIYYVLIIEELKLSSAVLFCTCSKYLPLIDTKIN
jgi:hypothetical protein